MPRQIYSPFGMPPDFVNDFWDVAVIGTGMGGAVAGHELAKAGHRVIFLEKGLADFPNANGALQLDTENPSARIQNGSWPTKITGSVNGGHSQFFAPLGCGAGGTTLLYAAALERFEPSDFDERWPITFEQLEPFYRKAEEMFKVHGTDYPLYPSEMPHLLPPSLMSECDEHFFESFKASGLNPYRLHVGYGNAQNCKECGGYVCPQKCKSDAKTICIEPALKTGNAYLLDRCEVERLEADTSSVKEIICQRDGKKISIRSRMVLLAAGAYFTPVLLLKSANEHWPNGLANSSGLVGRNLMFHVSDMIAIWPRGRYSMDGPRKTLAFRDFYAYKGIQLGSVQSTGLTAGYGNIIYFLKTAFDKSRWSWAKPVRPLLRIPAYIASLIFGNATIFATILEDKPYPENRITLDPKEPSGMRFNYTVHPELVERVEMHRRLIKNALARHRLMIITPEVNLNYGHPSGTCCFGATPSSSVLDTNNKTHELDNLYVVDASFMPTSGGASPSLTIAANALRVAAHIRDILHRDKQPDTNKSCSFAPK